MWTRLEADALDNLIPTRPIATLANALAVTVHLHGRIESAGERWIDGQGEAACAAALAILAEATQDAADAIAAYAQAMTKAKPGDVLASQASQASQASRAQGRLAASSKRVKRGGASRRTRVFNGPS